jgi:hypothetical protein
MYSNIVRLVVLQTNHGTGVEEDCVILIHLLYNQGEPFSHYLLRLFSIIQFNHNPFLYNSGLFNSWRDFAFRHSGRC